jgi:peptidylprolyl isomerase
MPPEKRIYGNIMADDSAGAKLGDRVKVHFTTRTPEGEIFESSREVSEEHDGSPQEIVLGDGSINQVFLDTLIGMKAGETREVKLAPEDAYGKYNPKLVFSIRKSFLSFKYDPQVGEMISIKLPNGTKALVKVLDIAGKKIKVDGNHPMAGKELTYELEMLEIEPAGE